MRWRSLVRKTAWAIGGTIVLGGSVLVHVDTSVGRRLATEIVNRALAENFKGKLVIDRLDRLSLVTGRIEVAARVFDPASHEVIGVPALRARIDEPRLLRSLAGRGPLLIRIEDVVWPDGRLALLTLPGGGISLAE